MNQDYIPSLRKGIKVLKLAPMNKILHPRVIYINHTKVSEVPPGRDEPYFEEHFIRVFVPTSADTDVALAAMVKGYSEHFLKKVESDTDAEKEQLLQWADATLKSFHPENVENVSPQHQTEG